MEEQRAIIEDKPRAIGVGPKIEILVPRKRVKKEWRKSKGSSLRAWAKKMSKGGNEAAKQWLANKKRKKRAARPVMIKKAESVKEKGGKR